MECPEPLEKNLVTPTMFERVTVLWNMYITGQKSVFLELTPTILTFEYYTRTKNFQNWILCSVPSFFKIGWELMEKSSKILRVSDISTDSYASLTLTATLLHPALVILSQVGSSSTSVRTSSLNSRLDNSPSPFSVLTLMRSDVRFLAYLKYRDNRLVLSFWCTWDGVTTG